MSNKITDFADKTTGEFKRKDSQFKNQIEAGGEFAPEKGRYHLYVSLACPWAHRCLIMRKLKGLDSIIDVSVVHWFMGQSGWAFSHPFNKGLLGGAEVDVAGATKDKLYDSRYVRDLYFKADPNYDGRFTVPVLWDSKNKTIVNNESSEIIRIFNTAFNELVDEEHKKLNFYPENLRPQIDEINAWIYDTINNGVYKSGFATKQEAYDTNVIKLFESLDRVEQILGQNGGKKFLIGDQLTEADVRLYTTIVRFDPVYHQHFKCNIKMIRHDYPHIQRWLKEMYWKNPAFKDTTDFEHIKKHYVMSHTQINPHSIVPRGPVPDMLPL